MKLASIKSEHRGSNNWIAYPTLGLPVPWGYRSGIGEQVLVPPDPCGFFSFIYRSASPRRGDWNQIAVIFPWYQSPQVELSSGQQKGAASYDNPIICVLCQVRWCPIRTPEQIRCKKPGLIWRPLWLLRELDGYNIYLVGSQLQSNVDITCRWVWLGITASPNWFRSNRGPHPRRRRSGLCGVRWRFSFITMTYVISFQIKRPL